MDARVGTHAWARRLVAGSLCALMLGATAVAQRRFGPQVEGMAFRFVAPAVGNRIASVAGVPGDPFTYYAGAASGGVWKTTDGGIRWTPVSDAMPVTAIGALAVTPTDPAIVWAGTGEAWAIRDSDVIGDGVYKSMDAGKTWVNMGLGETGRIGRILVHPSDPNTVFVCAVGRATGKQKERGVFRTTDGGAHWEHVLFVDENTGCSGLSMDARNPRFMVAGTWQVEMHPWAMFSGGAGSGVYVSRDGGTKWTKVDGRGMPKSPLGKIDVAIAPTNSNRVYALIQTADQGSLWRSDDGGDNWRVVNWQRGLIGRAGYYIRLAVSPKNEDEVLVSDSSFWQSTDGGVTFEERGWGGDNHDIWWDPKDADRFVITHDGGLSITQQHGRSIQRVNLPIGQMYHVAVDNQVPYYLYSNMQDNSTMRGPFNQMEIAGGGYGVPVGVWEHNLGGCESGFTIPDPADSNIVWASCYGNKVTRYDARTKTARSVAPSIITLDAPVTDVKYRTHWSAPLAIDPFDHNNVLYGAQVIFQTLNGGQSWKVISPDLSRQDPAHIVQSGGIVGDNLGQFAGSVVFAIAFSPTTKGVVWAGTNDGKIWNSKDGGAKWNDVTAGLAAAGAPELGVVSKIDPSNFDGGTAYAVVDAHLLDSREPYIFKTTDYGTTWKRVNGDLPNKSPLDYARSVAEDPNKKGLLFAGTGHAFYYSLNDGVNWTPISAGLPHAPVTWIVVQKQFHDVVISTYGRGLFVLDDITPLEQQAGAAPQTNAVELYPVRPSYRWSKFGQAAINYNIKELPKGPIQIQILDSTGKVVRDGLRAPARLGVNRTMWDLRYDSPRLVQLRTTPDVNPHIWEEPRFRGRDTRPVTHWGLDQAQVGPIVGPGMYTVKLTVDGKSYTQMIGVMQDPSQPSTEQDLQASVNLQLKIRADINETSDMINTLEVMRKQLEEARKGLTGLRKTDVVKLVDEMAKKMFDVEAKLLEPAQMTSDDKYFQQAYRVYMNLIWLNGEVGPGAGDVAGGADYKPTDTSVGILADIEKDLAAARAAYKALLEKDLPAFNKTMTEKGLPAVVGE